MTGPSAVTVSLMDGAWKEVKRLPLGPSLSDAWWRFGGLIEVKVSSNRAKFPAVITKKIRGTAMRYEGTSKASPPQSGTEEERDAFSTRRKIGVFVLGSQLSQDSPKAYCVHEHLSHCPPLLEKWKHHSGALHSRPGAVTAGGLTDTAPHPCRTTCETASSNVLAPFTIWKLEFSLFPFFFCPEGCYVGKTSRAVCAIKIQRAELHIISHTVGPLSHDVPQEENVETRKTSWHGSGLSWWFSY